MTDISYFSPPALGFTNRSTTLLVVGICFIIAGAIAGCLGIFTPLSLLAPQTAQNGPPQMSVLISGMIMYLLGSAATLTLGIGAVRKRRWSGPLILAGSWIVLFGGIAGLAMLAFRVPAMAAGMRASMASVPGRPAPPPGLVNIMLAVVLLFSLLFYLIVPGLLAWIFSNRNIRLTLEYFDPHPCWTDHIALPALIMVLALGLSSIGALMLTAQGWCPAFGMVLYGIPAAAVTVTLGVLLAVATYLAGRLRSSGWWLGFVCWIAYGISWIATLLHADMREVYRHIGMNEKQLDLLAQMHAFPDATMGWITALFMLAVVGFSLRMRRYFNAGETTAMPPV